MKDSKFIPALALLMGLAAASLSASTQTQLVTGNFFPAPLEFQELQAIQSEKDVTSTADLARLQNAPSLMEAGVTRFSERTYALAGGGQISISVATFGDARSAYSVFTLWAPSAAQPGPPGNSFSVGNDSLVFVSGDVCVLVQTSAKGDLIKKVALSVSNRIGTRNSGFPNLLKHVPSPACNPATAKFLVGPHAMAAFGLPVGGEPFKLPSDVEVAQAGCSAVGQTGNLTLLNFPSIPLAETYFESGVATRRETAGNLYTRQTGPLVAILEGNFSPENADKTLSSIKFSYSIKWIYDKNNQQGRTIWGVPVRLLSTVVRSILFTVLLCVGSVFAGILVAVARVFARRHGWGADDESAYIRLKLDEN